MSIIFLGIPGSGKGTQAERILKNYDFKHISTGDLLREEILKKTELSIKVKDLLNRGLLVSNDIINEIVRNNLEIGKKYILDGYPRTLNQAVYLDSFYKQNISIVIYLNLDEEKAVNRLISRAKCTNCGKIGSLLNSDSCSVCGFKLESRSDDNEPIIRKRMQVYKKETEPLLSYYQDQNKLVSIDASYDIDEIYEKIIPVLEKA